MEVIVLAALITAFLAGIAALLAPCCIGVLLPAYFGSIFRQKRTVLLMTLVFFFGLLAVFLPLGLGMGFLGQAFKAYHDSIYLAASVFFLALGLSILAGLHFSLPFKTRSQVKVTGAFSVFILGVFSGFATLCCAPVLAGAIALSALPGSVFWGGLYSVVYVLGMVSPLLLISSFLDRKGIMEDVNLFRKEVSYSIFSRKISLTMANLFSGVLFMGMGAILLYKSMTNQIAMSPSESQLQINILLSRATDAISQFLSTTFGLAVFFISIALVLFLLARPSLNNWRAKNESDHPSGA